MNRIATDDGRLARGHRETIFGNSYSKIAYETTYVGAVNNAPILINKGTIPATIGPGRQKIPKSMTRYYPGGARAWLQSSNSLAPTPRLNSRVRCESGTMARFHK